MDILEWFYIILFGGFGLFILIGGIISIIWGDYSKHPKTPIIKFKHFLDYYNLFPNNWDMDDGIGYNVIWYKNSKDHNYELQFNPIDYLRFKHFYKQLQKNKEHIERRNTEVAFLKSIQKDIKAKKEDIELDNIKNYLTMINLANSRIKLSQQAGCSYKDLTVPKSTDIIVKNGFLTEAEIEQAWTKHITAFDRGKLSTYCGTVIPSTINSYEEFRDCIKAIEKGVNYEQR